MRFREGPGGSGRSGRFRKDTDGSMRFREGPGGSGRIKEGLIVLGRVWKDPGVSCRVWEAVTGSRRVWISMTDLHWYGRVHEGLGWYQSIW